MQFSHTISFIQRRFATMVAPMPSIKLSQTSAVLSALLLLTAVITQAQTITALYSFCSVGDNNCAAGPDGSFPQSALTRDLNGGFYGTTYEGGLSYGAVFRLSPNGSGGWNETIIYKFTGGAAGSIPWFSNVILDKTGDLYGTLAYGGNGADGYGVIFKLSPAGADWKETVLYRFLGGTDGASPINGLVLEHSGILYGKTKNGGTGGNGTIFELSPSVGGWKERVIYNLDAGYAGLVLDAAGNIYSTSATTVFRLSQNSDGTWTPKILHTFSGVTDGSFPAGTPVFDASGNLYGTTVMGGATNQGTVYKLTPQPNGQWKEDILHSFPGGSKGSQPWAGIVFDPAGNIYGSTLLGPESGLVYELIPTDANSYKEEILAAFTGVGGSMGLFSDGSLILDTAGDIFGTTEGGGQNAAGTVFKITR